MSINFRRFIGGINLVGTSVSNVSVGGEIEFYTGTNKLNFHNGTTASYLVDETHQATLTNKIFSDSTAVFGNVSDTTKQVIFSIGGQTTAVTATLTFACTSNRVITFPDATGTLVFTNGAGGQTLTNVNLTDANCFVVNSGDATKKFGWSLGGATTGKTVTIVSSHTNNRSLTLPDNTDTLAAIATQQTFTNKIFSDSTAVFGNVADTTKQLVFSLGGATTAKTMTFASSHTNNRTITFPDTTDIVAVLALQQTFTNKIFSDSTTPFGNVADTTKQLLFSLGGATTAKTMTIASSHTNNRTMTIPDATDTFAALTTAQSFTNKTIGDALTYTQIATPANPSAGLNKLYVKSNNKFYTLTSGGIEQQLGSGTGGAKNYLTTYLNNTGNGDFELGATTGWSLAHSTLSSSVPTSVAAAGTAFDSTHGGTAATALAVNVQNTQSIATTATWVSGNSFITVASNTGIVVGQIVTNPGAGTGFPAPPTGGNIFVTNISSNSIYLSKAVTGTQASASNMTFASTPIGGTWSATLGTSSQSANVSSTAGDLLISSAFTIDTEDQAKVMQIKFYYQNLAGAALSFLGTSSGNFAVYIYDVSNAAWIQPAGVYNLVQSTGVGYCTATFQTTSNSTQYQIALINITATSSLSYDIMLDDFSVGPQIAPTGPAMTDEVVWTPTFTGFGTVSAVSFVSKRVGDRLLVRGDFTAGTTTATQARISIGYNGVDGNVTVGSTAVAATQVAGWWTSTGNGFHGSILATTGNAYVTMGLVGASNAGYANVNASVAVATGASVTVFFEVPITGWSSNTSQSSDTDTRVVALDASGTPTGTLTNSAYNTAIYGTVNNDTHGAYASSTGVYTVPVTGYYSVSAGAAVTGTFANNGSLHIAVVKNGTIVRDAEFINTSSTGQMQASIGANSILCNSGDTIKIQTAPFNWTGVSYAAVTGANFFNVVRSSGPAVIAATESVNAAYHGSASAISGILAPITYSTKDFDSHNAYSAGTYTIPVSGKYQVNAGFATTRTSSASTITVQINKNGSGVASGLITNISATAGTTSVDCSHLVSCNAGDTITIQGSDSGTSPAISNTIFSFFSISRVGN